MAAWLDATTANRESDISTDPHRSMVLPLVLDKNSDSAVDIPFRTYAPQVKGLRFHAVWSSFLWGVGFRLDAACESELLGCTGVCDKDGSFALASLSTPTGAYAGCQQAITEEGSNTPRVKRLKGEHGHVVHLCVVD